MNKIKYMIKRICTMHYDKMFLTAKRIAKKENKNVCKIFLDMIYCGFKYMAGYVDYEAFDFANLTKEQRESIITRGVNNKFVATLNDKEYIKYLDDKLLFNEKFNQFLKREWINLKSCSYEDFEKFIKKHKVIIAKPTDLACGRGVQKITIDNTINIKELYDNLITNKQFLVEECVVQSEEMSTLYPNSVNTLRIVTVTKNNKPNIMFRANRIYYLN